MTEGIAVSRMSLVEMSLPAARLGEDNPLPPFAPSIDAHAGVSPDPGIEPEDRRWLGWGMTADPLPYRMQDGYERRLERRSFLAVVLENEHLSATFLPELGGRLWSLRSMRDGRELLFANRAFQPGNLAIRNAWFAGGIEWNIGLVGHSPFTCSRVFSARATGPSGEPMLRLWEWERIRRVPFQIDVLLPDGSRALLIHVSIANPNAETVPMYWWSNAAVPESPGMRVMAPAARAYTFAYGGVIRGVDVPISEGVDITRPESAARAVDYFFRVPDTERPWVAAVDRDGRGLAQTSTPRLRGRKLFLWGTSPGGRRWQEFLCGPGDGYVEIQSGLARTQAEHLPMPAGARWSWLEAYGPIECSPTLVHGPDWPRALDPRRRPSKRYQRTLREMHAALTAALTPGKMTLGTGWAPWAGTREGRPDGAAGRSSRARARATAWLELLEQGFRGRDGGPPSFMVGVASAVEASVRDITAHRSENHLGARAHDGEREAAAQAFRESLACRRTPWALRNLAEVVRIAGDADRACDLLMEAQGERPDFLPLALEAGSALVAAGRHEEWLALVQRLPPDIRTRGRVRLLEGRAALALGRLDQVQAIFDRPPEIPDMREGEASLTDLWFSLREREMAAKLRLPLDEALRRRVRIECPPPAAIDFRVSPEV
jgi:hypothetical protein